MDTGPVTVRPARHDDGAELARLVAQAEAVFQRVPIKDPRLAASRFALVATLRRDVIAGLISLWPEPPFPWLDALAVMHVRLSHLAVRALLAQFMDVMRKRGARRVLVSAHLNEPSSSPLLRHALAFGFRPLADFRRFHKSDLAIPDLRDDSHGSVVIRPGADHDLPDLQRIESSSFSAPWDYDESQLRDLVRLSHRLAVATVDGKVAGYCSTVRKGGCGHVKRIAVHQEYRGLGAGARLLADAIHFLGLAGASHVELRSERGLGAAWRLFKRFGFRRVGVDRRVYGYDLVDRP